MTRWEYATLEFWVSAKRETMEPLPERGLGGRLELPKEPTEKWVYWNDYYLRLPGQSQSDKRAGWTSEDPSTVHHRFLDLLNELGSEGWEVISDSVLRSGLNLNTRGWGNTSEPIHRVLMLKRPSTYGR